MECGIVGYGNFSKVMAGILKDYFTVYVYDKREEYSVPNYVKKACLPEVLSKEVVILSIPVQYLEEFLKKNREQINLNRQMKLFDVCSVKMKPVQLIRHYLDPEIYYLGVHPLFGPMSIQEDLEGLNIVLSPVVEWREFDQKVEEFLTNTLKLRVIRMSPEEHDKEMAMVQGVSHFIARGLLELEPKESKVFTKGYNKMLEMYQIFKNDSFDLFYTLENENPYAEALRKRYLQALCKIERELRDARK